MTEMTDLRKVQQRTHQLITFEDGLWDMLLGFIFLELAVYPVTREWLGPEGNMVLYLGVLGILVVGQLVVRQYVSRPRIGYVRANSSPKVRLLVLFTVAMFLLTLGLVLVTLISPTRGSAADNITLPATGRSYLVELIVVLVEGVIFSVMGYIFGVPRLYLYGWMLGLANLASIYMAHNAGWTFQFPTAAAAGIILAIGFAKLIRFLRRYPVRAEGA